LVVIHFLRQGGYRHEGRLDGANAGRATAVNQVGYRCHPLIAFSKSSRD